MNQLCYHPREIDGQGKFVAMIVLVVLGQGLIPQTVGGIGAGSNSPDSWWYWGRV